MTFGINWYKITQTQFTTEQHPSNPQSYQVVHPHYQTERTKKGLLTDT